MDFVTWLLVFQITDYSSVVFCVNRTLDLIFRLTQGAFQMLACQILMTNSQLLLPLLFHFQTSVSIPRLILSVNHFNETHVHSVI